MDEDLDYHRARAVRELNLGLASTAIPVARAHLRLSALHFHKAREIGARMVPPPRIEPPPFVL